LNANLTKSEVIGKTRRIEADYKGLGQKSILCPKSYRFLDHWDYSYCCRFRSAINSGVRK
ncbi:MAG: hypothetical protein LBE97_00850, partial [Holosporales bacterium]|nr:hypothetical protein [Holosporales bacterium]